MDEVAYSVASDSYNFIYVVGSGENLADDNTGLDWWIKKFDVNGYELDESDGWKDKEGLIFDGVGGADEALCVTTYGTDVYVVGYRTNTDADRDWWIKKFDMYGTEDTTNWNKIFDWGGGDDEAKSVAVDGDGNVYVAGYVTFTGSLYIDKDWLIKKFDSSGTEDTSNSWNTMFDGIGSDLDDVAYSIAIDNSRYISGTVTEGNDDVYVVGYATGDDGFKDWWIKKFLSDGIEDLGWNMVLDSIDSGDAEAYSVTIDLDDKDNEDELYVYVAGYVTTAAGGKDWWIKKFDKDANTVTGWDNMVFGETDDDVAYTIAVDYYSYNVDWRYYYRSGSATGDRCVNTDPDGDNWYASPPNGAYGGLYALDVNDNPYIFQDTGDSDKMWEYDANDNYENGDPYNFYIKDGGEYKKYLDPDNDGIFAVPEIGQSGGLYALDDPASHYPEVSEPYTFKDLDGDWMYDDGELLCLDPDCDEEDAFPQFGQEGGLYALDDHYPPRPYTFKDKINDEFVYVVGYKTSGADKDWWIQKFNPSGSQSWQVWYSQLMGDDEAWSIAIDSYRRIYIAGYGTNLGDGTGSDWWIEKLNYDKSNPSGTLINTERWSLPYSWQYSAACRENEGRSEEDMARLRYYGYLISKDFQIPPLLDDDIYIVEMKAHLGPSSYYYLDPYYSYHHTASMILLSQSRENYDASYVVTARNYPDYPDKISSEFTFRKYVNSIGTDLDVQDMSFLKSAGVDGEGLIMRSYVYKDASGTNINSYLYHPNTFVPYSHSISILDDSAPTAPTTHYTSGRIGLLPDHWSYFYVDWIRVLKSTKNPPTVTIGAMEPLNFGWELPVGFSLEGIDRNTEIFCTDPLYYDFINVPMTGEDGAINPEGCSKFYIYRLLPGKYAITLTMGDTGDTGETTKECHLVYSCIRAPRDGYPDETFNFVNCDPVQLPLTDIGQFKRAWFTVDGMDIQYYIDICLVFYDDSIIPKPISSLTIDRLLLSEYGIALLRGTE